MRKSFVLRSSPEPGPAPIPTRSEFCGVEMLKNSMSSLSKSYGWPAISKLIDVNCWTAAVGESASHLMLPVTSGALGSNPVAVNCMVTGIGAADANPTGIPVNNRLTNSLLNMRPYLVWLFSYKWLPNKQKLSLMYQVIDYQ